jgi:hypothetical protein
MEIKIPVKLRSCTHTKRAKQKRILTALKPVTDSESIESFFSWFEKKLEQTVTI